MTRAARAAVALNRRAVARRKPIDWEREIVRRVSATLRFGAGGNGALHDAIRVAADETYKRADKRRSPKRERERITAAIKCIADRLQRDGMRRTFPKFYHEEYVA